MASMAKTCVKRYVKPEINVTSQHMRPVITRNYSIYILTLTLGIAVLSERGGSRVGAIRLLAGAPGPEDHVPPHGAPG